MSPCFDFYCRGCNKKINDVLSSGEDNLCPYCGGRMVKMPAAPNIIFKGPGWTEKFYNRDKK